jgi:hypothetical protein
MRKLKQSKNTKIGGKNHVEKVSYVRHPVSKSVYRRENQRKRRLQGAAA